MSTHPKKIAVIAGDGIGKEVMPEGLRALQAAAQKFDLPLEFHHFDWAHCDYYAEHGQMMPNDWKRRDLPRGPARWRRRWRATRRNAPINVPH